MANKPNTQVSNPSRDGSRLGIGCSVEHKRIGLEFRSNGWPHITNAMLRDDFALVGLYDYYVSAGFMPDTEEGLLILFEAAQNAIEHGKRNKPGLFVARLCDWRTHRLHRIKHATCDRAHARLKRARGHDAVAPRAKEAR
ncbi:hypothetical protein LCGC14_0323030 [marine sediment metagenome]|uniref:Uncharacterized protein n=1 Tax=marine sediment metagenome TaxID=412755 RepID=A0A0F9TP28_9ZZZZ